MADNMGKKNVLCITGIPTGMRAFFLEGKEEFTGMPAFKEVFMNLLNHRHLNKLNLFLFVNASEKGNISIPEIYKDKINISEYFYERSKPVSSIFSLVRIFIYGIWQSIFGNIHSIAGYSSHGSALAALIGFFTGKKTTRRIFGTFLYNEINDPNWKLFIRHPLEYLSFRIPNGTLFVTNDGTKGDKVYDKIGTKNLDFQFLINGVDPEIGRGIEQPNFELPNRFMVYIARIADWKRQHLLIEALGVLKKKGIDILPSYIIGPVTDDDYLLLLQSKIKENGLVQDITIIKGVSSKEGHYLLKNAYLSFSLYHTSNLGNVFLECIALGGVMIAINDTNSLSNIPENIYVEVKESKAELIASKIEALLNDENKREAISQRAKQYAKKEFSSWKDRRSIEIETILG